jgi:hypothetical protein
MDFIVFENQEYFYLFIAHTRFSFGVWFSNYTGKRKLQKLGQWPVIQRMMPMRSTRRPWLKLVCFVL